MELGIFQARLTELAGVTWSLQLGWSINPPPLHQRHTHTHSPSQPQLQQTLTQQLVTCTCWRAGQAVSQEDGTDLDPSGALDAPAQQHERGGEDVGSRKDGAPPVGTILKGRVHSIKPFGVFIALDGWRNHGLVHFRQAGPLHLLRFRVYTLSPQPQTLAPPPVRAPSRAVREHP